MTGIISGSIISTLSDLILFCINATKYEYCKYQNVFFQISFFLAGLVKCLTNAAVDGNYGAIVEILDNEVHVDSRDEITYTALEHAAIHNRPEVVELLLERGADVNKQDDSGNTPLHFAVYNNSTEVIKVLKKWGASPEIENNKGRRPCDETRA